jgi:exodeoxyribonuclease VII large subunit
MTETLPEQGMLPPDREVFTVSRLNRTARLLLEEGLPRVWIEGEISNLARPSSGHLYFTLKDDQAQVRGAMFRSRNQLLRFKPADGMQVLVRARISLYEARGEYQFIAESMQEAGDGVLQRAYEALKQKLEQEGLFDPAWKKPLPALPARIGVITSPTGAAIRDVLSVLQRRFPAIPVLIYPVPVQGKDAGREIAAMLRTAAQRSDCEVLVLTRGGGSLEDLWAFNEEIVARAIHACEIPVISAVGHEVDFTIADFVADRRAPTPSAAAELVSPDQQEWLQQLVQLERRLARRMDTRLVAQQQRMQWVIQRLQLRHPGQLLRQQAQRLDELEQRYRLAMRIHINKLQSSVQHVYATLLQHTPSHRIERIRLQHNALEQRLRTAMQALLKERQRRFAVACRTLDTISPLATLERGYAIVNRAGRRDILRRATDTTVGEQVETRLADGSLLCTVDEIRQKR